MVRQNDGATSRGSGWKAPCSWCVLMVGCGAGAAVLPIPHHSQKVPGVDQGQQQVLACGASGQPLLSLGLRTSLSPQRFPRVTQRLVPPVKPLFGYSKDGPGK